jgi:hypothetical protein
VEVLLLGAIELKVDIDLLKGLPPLVVTALPAAALVSRREFVAAVV